MNYEHNYLKTKNIYSSKIKATDLVENSLELNKKHYIKDIFDLKSLSSRIFKPRYTWLGSKTSDSVGFQRFSNYENINRSFRRRDSLGGVKKYVQKKIYVGSLLKLWGKVRNTLEIGDEIFSRYFKYSYYLRYTEHKKIDATALWFVKKLKKKEAYELREKKRRKKKEKFLRNKKQMYKKKRYQYKANKKRRKYSY